MAQVFAVSALRCTELHRKMRGCRYDVQWAINPHMRVGSVSYARAREQHDAFTRTLRRLGAKLVELPFVHGAFDCVFTKDSALLLRDGELGRALLANPRFGVRRREQRARARALACLGWRVSSPPVARWEGGDVVVLPHGAGLLLGHGFRSDPRVASWLERHTGLPVHAIGLTDPHLFHLDMAVSVLPNGVVLACVDALERGALFRLRRVAGVTDIVVVSREDALGFGLNLVAVGDDVVVAGAAPPPRVERALEGHGIRTVVVPLGEFHRAGGSAACLVSAVHHPRAAGQITVPRGETPRVSSLRE